MTEANEVVLKPETPGKRLERLLRHGRCLQRALDVGEYDVHQLIYPDESGNELEYLLLNHEGWGLPPMVLSDPEYIQKHYRGVLDQDEIIDKLKDIREDIGIRDFLKNG